MEQIRLHVPEITNFIDCPNCRHEWSLDEVRMQECDECGYPFHKSPQVMNEFDPDYIGPDEPTAIRHAITQL